MTRVQLLTAVKNEARIPVGTQYDSIILAVFDDLLTDAGNRTRYREVLAVDTPITLVDAQSTYQLPTDFQHLFDVRYAYNAQGNFRPLDEFTDGQNRISNNGIPRFYFLNSGGITLFPAGGVLAAATCLISYYQNPKSLFTTDGSEFPIPRLEPQIKKNAIARMVRFMQNLDEAQVVKTDAVESFSANQGGQ